MKAIPLWQPWASLWIGGWKIHETRHWPITKQWPAWKPGDRAVVHAAQRFEKNFPMAFAEILRARLGLTWYRDLPRGCLLGTVEITACVPTETLYRVGSFERLSPAEREDFLCGDFSDARFAWAARDPRPFPKPVQWRGHQGIFNVPDEFVSAQFPEAA